MAVSEKLLSAKSLKVSSLAAMSTHAGKPRQLSDVRAVVRKLAQEMYGQILALCKAAQTEDDIEIAVTRIVMDVARTNGFGGDSKLDTNSRNVLEKELHLLLRSSNCFAKRSSRGYRYLPPELRSNGAKPPIARTTARSLADSQAT